MTTTIKDDLEWRSPPNLASSLTWGEPARVRWPGSAEKPLADHQMPWRYGYLVWDWWFPLDTNPALKRGKVQFAWAEGKSMDVDNRGQVEVQRPRKGLGR